MRVVVRVVIHVVDVEREVTEGGEDDGEDVLVHREEVEDLGLEQLEGDAAPAGVLEGVLEVLLDLDCK